jgi:N-acetyltransferase
MQLAPGVLAGRFVRLEPYAPALKADLGRALDCDPDAWSLLASSGAGAQFDGWWERHWADMQAGAEIAYAVRRISDGAVMGTSSFLNIKPEHRGVEIGATFLRPEARGGPINPDMKLLMLSCAFSAGALRVEIITDARNTRSAAAIAKLGAVREGVLRRHRVTWTGHIRDTLVFSVTDEEWPAVRARLEARVAAG